MAPAENLRMTISIPGSDLPPIDTDTDTINRAAVLGRSAIACRIKAHRRGIARRYRRRQPKPERTRA
jgi:hypothetical protein